MHHGHHIRALCDVNGHEFIAYDALRLFAMVETGGEGVVEQLE